MDKLSRSKIDLFLECPRCFWLEVKQGIKRPPPAPYTINSAIDWLLKQEFDLHREKGTAHPVMKKFKIDAIPYNVPQINDWRNNFKGVRHHHEPTDFTVFGAIDDVWVNPDKELIVVDYKATGANQHRIYDSYKRQIEIYQWLLEKNGLKVAPFGYFVFARVNKGNGFGISVPPGTDEDFCGLLRFDMFVEKCECDNSWIEETLLNARKVFDSDEIPTAGSECEYCRYRNSASNFIS